MRVVKILAGLSHLISNVPMHLEKLCLSDLYDEYSLHIRLCYLAELSFSTLDLGSGIFILFEVR